MSHAEISGGPVAIGGLGGSGTRVVANILAQSGVRIGAHLNGALDNLFFTNLLKDPQWQSTASDAEIQDRLALFARCTGGLPLRWRDVPDYIRARRRNRTPGTGALGLRHLIPWRGTADRERRWGWKEPNTHIYLVHLPHVFLGIRYVHVIRNPLEMAYSENRQQLTNWGDLFGISPPEGSETNWSDAQFRFSLAANSRAVEQGQRIFGDRFLLLHFEALCRAPKREIAKLLDFAAIEPPPAEIARLAQSVQAPRTAGRHLTRDSEWVTDQQLRQAERLGYDLTDVSPAGQPESDR